MSTYNFDIKDGIILLCFLAMLVFKLDSCSDKKELMKANNELLNYSDSIKTYKSKNGELVEFNKALVINYGTQLEEIDKLKKDLDLKRVDVLVKYKSVFKYDTINHVFREQLPCEAFTDSFTVDSTHFRFDAVLSNKLLSLYNIEVPNEQNFVIGEKKNGLFKENEYSVLVTNSNPNIKGESLKAYTFKPSPKWYNSIGFKGAVFVAGVIGGFLLAK
jgi:transcriptional regulator of met regulon